MDTSTSIYQLRTIRPFVTAAVIGAVVFAVLAIAVHVNSGTNGFDVGVATWFADSRTGAMESLGTFIAAATTPFVLVAVAAIASVVTWATGKRREAVILAGSVFIAYLIGAMAKRVEGRARPLAPINLSPESESSFPSGHVLVVTTIAFVALGLAWAYMGRTGRIIATMVATAAVLIVSLDRLVVGAHWFTDVMGSLSLATVIGSLALIANRRFRPN